MTRTVYDPGTGRTLEVEVLYAGGPLPWQRVPQPGLAVHGTLDAYTGGEVLETRPEPAALDAPRPCAWCDEPMVRRPTEHLSGWRARRFCCQHCAALGTGRRVSTGDRQRRLVLEVLASLTHRSGTTLEVAGRTTLGLGTVSGRLVELAAKGQVVKLGRVPTGGRPGYVWGLP